MAWNFNFCAPHLPNDPTINFHRYLQTGCLAGLLLIYVLIHAYYKICGPDPNSTNKDKQQNNSENASQNEKGSDQNSENQDDKSISIAGGCAADQNSSYVTFNNTDKKKKKQAETKKKIQTDPGMEKVTIEEVQSYFPIVFGHFSIASTLAITYSPYAEQSIATFVYILLGILLVIVNSKRKIKTTRVVWGFMCFIICFLAMSGLLEVGQANYNKMQQQCFSVGYQALY